MGFHTPAMYCTPSHTHTHTHTHTASPPPSGLGNQGSHTTTVPEDQSPAPPEGSAFVEAVNAGGGPPPDHAAAAIAEDGEEEGQEGGLTDSQAMAMAMAAARNTTETSGASFFWVLGCVVLRLWVFRFGG